MQVIKQDIVYNTYTVVVIYFKTSAYHLNYDFFNISGY